MSPDKINPKFSLLKELASQLPEEPGVYLYKDAKNQYIYIGKAKNLKNRVTSYFHLSSQPSKTLRLMEYARDLEFIVTASEAAALELEAILVNKYRPKYNIFLKDDKGSPYLKITLQERFPRVNIVRHLEDDGARYYRTFTSTKVTQNVLQMIRKTYPLCICSSSIRCDHKERPCLYSYIGKCAAPCVGEMDETSYRKMAEEFCEFMEGKTNQIIERLNQEMESLSEAMEYEKAAEVRDKLQDIQKLTGKIRLVSATPRTQDLIALAVSGREACVQIFYLQDEQTVDRRIFLLDKIEDAGVEEILSSFLRQYYVSSPVPERVLIGTVPQDMESHRQWLESKRKDNKLDFFVPREGTKEHELIKLAENNARLSLKHRLARIERKKALTEGAVAELKNRLNLPTLPSHIEGFDISNIQGADAVGSMVFFLNGAPFRKGYRKFRIKEKQGRPDDVGMMREVVRRRYTRVLNEKKELPDLILIDGGKSQLNGAYDELEALGLDQIPIIGLAKQFEEIYLPGQKDPILLPQDSPALYLCQRIRDEAHRFAITYHKKLRTKRLSLSQLDEIPGIGGKRKKILLDHFGGSIENIRQASLEELETVPNLPKKVAEAVYVWFQEH